MYCCSCLENSPTMLGDPRLLVGYQQQKPIQFRNGYIGMGKGYLIILCWPEGEGIISLCQDLKSPSWHMRRSENTRVETKQTKLLFSSQFGIADKNLTRGQYWFTSLLLVHFYPKILNIPTKMHKNLSSAYMNQLIDSKCIHLNRNLKIMLFTCL